MLARLLVLLTLAGLTFATSLTTLINNIGIHEIANISELTTKLLFKYPMIHVANDNSVITSQYLLDMVGNSNADALLDFDSSNKVNNPRKKMFVQSNIGDCETKIEVSEWTPIDGCIDNSLADTVTTITRTSTVKLGNSLGPKIYFMLLGNRATLSLSGGYGHSVSEKIYCDIQPGDMLQLHRKVTTMWVENLKQREVKVGVNWFFRKSINFDEWEDIDPEKSTFQIWEQLACVTDPELLKCHA